MTYLNKVAIGFDQFVNTLFNGYPDETLSARAYRLYNDGKTSLPMHFINALFFWQRGHCHSAFVSEIDRKQYPAAYR